MVALRQEKDSLGWVAVPKNALFGAQTARAIQDYPISERTAHVALIRAYLRLKAAAANANYSCHVLKKRNKELIHRAIDILLAQLDEGNRWKKIFPIDPYQAGAGTSQNMNINEVIANQANLLAGNPLGAYFPVHPNDDVNQSQSTNDTFPTATKLALLETSKPLVDELLQLSKTLGVLAKRWHSIPKSARTHLQDAVPMRLGQEFGAYAATFKRCGDWILRGRESLLELGIGGSAAGTGLNVPRGFTDEIAAALRTLCGEKVFVGPNLCELMQSQFQIGVYSSTLKASALELIRFCNDLRLLASGPSTGLAEIHLPATQPGSSIMPGKTNPSVLELANQAWFSVLGFDQTVSFCLQAGQLELNVMVPMMAHATLEATQIMTRTLKILRKRCIEGVQPNIPVLKKYSESTSQIATALSPTLGYARTAELVKESIASGKSVIRLVEEKKLIPEKKLKSLVRAAKAF